MYLPAFRSNLVTARIMPGSKELDDVHSGIDSGSVSTIYTVPHIELVFTSPIDDSFELSYNVVIISIAWPVDKAALTREMTKYMHVINGMCGNALRVHAVRFYEEIYLNGMLSHPKIRPRSEDSGGRLG